MLKLKNVSKFYYNKGVIASGFSKINLEFELGEFVAITGESGSGKSTLLNVLAGLDSYEEGEMYINGEETSHYSEVDLEDYRKKYIGNIFQSFNLVNSYTVYQNIELVLLLNGENKKDIKEKIINIIKEVGLIKYKKTKVSKLSGGQKQRVAIARALAKDTPIILADEPTGNLDSKSATSVLKLLSEVAKDKLVIIVTHNYDQIEEYATRKIKMHDGSVLEDKELKKHDEVSIVKINNFKQISLFNQILLGIRNTFNVIPKFLLLMVVFLFLSLSVISVYASFKEQSYKNSINGWNQYFSNITDNRIVIKKDDKSPFTDEDYAKIKKISNIDYINKDDLLIDMQLNMSVNNYYFNVYAKDISLLKNKPDIGVMPKEENEIVIAGYSNDYYLKNNYNEIINKEIVVGSNQLGEDILNRKLKIVGIYYTNDYHNEIYTSTQVLNDIRLVANKTYSNTSSTLNNKTFKNEYGIMDSVIPNAKVPKGQVYASEELNYNCNNFNCKNNNLKINVNNIYFNETIDLNVSNLYNKNNMKNLLDVSYETYNGAFFVNLDDYHKLYEKDIYQSSIFVKDIKVVKDTIKELNNLKINGLYLVDTLYNPMAELGVIVIVIQAIMIGFLLFSVFMISYFIVKIILKSRNIYFSTIRILGASKKVSKRLLEIELFTVANLAFFIVIGLILLVAEGVIQNPFVYEILSYLRFKDYLLLYIILSLTSYLLAIRFAKGLFKKSAMTTYREEV